MLHSGARPFHKDAMPDFRTPFYRLLMGLALLGGVVLTSSAQEANALIPWSADLNKGAGVSTVVVRAAAVGAQGGLLQGTVVLPAQQTDKLSMPVAGVVQSVLVSPMQAVRAGQPVARIMSPQLVEWQREWLMAQAQARLAQNKAQRDEQMFADGIVAEHRRNESRAQSDMATLAERERRQALRLAGLSDAELNAASSSASLSPLLTLVAPAAGTVLELPATPGQRLEAGAPVATLGRGGALAIELQASAAQAQALRVGDILVVQGCKAPARVTAVSNQLSAANQSVQLRAVLTAREDCLRINQFVQAQWQAARPAGPATQGAAWLVPTAAVFQHGGRQYVFVREQPGFRAVAVTTGVGSGADTPVLSGLKAGDEVAVQGLIAIKGAWLGLGVPTPAAKDARP